jgi:glutamine synthetase adenylyltransferase
MVADEQTAAELTKYLRRVQAHYASLFEDAPPLAAIDGKFVFPPDGDDRETLETLKRLGFKEPLAASSLVRDWLKGTHRSLRAEAARADLEAIVPALVIAIGRTGQCRCRYPRRRPFLFGAPRLGSAACRAAHPSPARATARHHPRHGPAPR